MNETRNNNTGSFDTIELEENENTTKISTFKKIKTLAKKQLFSIRHYFADSCDKSYISNLFDNLYFSILNCRLKVFGTFLITMSAVSLLLSYAIEPKLNIFLTSVNVFSSAVILLIGLIFLTCNKKVSDVLSQSSVFSSLDIVYSQPAIITSSGTKKMLIESYSTSFFTGALAGILSVIFPSTSIVLFLLALCYIIFVFARPECGVLFSIFTLPLFTSEISAFVSIITFLALLYKYLRGKRHIDFRIMEGMLISSACYIILRCSLTGITAQKALVLVQYIAFFLMFISVISLVRTTSMLRRSISVAITLSRFYLILCLLFYICFAVFGKTTTMLYFENLGFEGLVIAITSQSFIIPFLSIATPLCFSNILIKNSKEIVKNSIYFVLFIALSSFVKSFIFTLLLLVFSLLVLILSGKKRGVLIVVTPVAAFGIHKLFDIIPKRFSFTASSIESVSLEKYWSHFKGNMVFGAGIANPINIGSGFLAMLYTLGIAGMLILMALIGMICYKSIKSVFSIKDKNIKISTYSNGLLSSAFCFLTTTVFFNTLHDFRPALLFAAILSLAFTSGRCFDEDYVDPFLLREQTIHN